LPGPKALRATTCFGPDLTRAEIISLQKKEAARARHLREAEAARVHNREMSGRGAGPLKHVLVPGGDTHTCEACGASFSTMLRARNLNRACVGKPEEGPEPAVEEGPPDPTRHKLRRAGKDWECSVCLRRESKKRLEETRCRGPGTKTKSELLVLHNAERVQTRREKERLEARAHNAAAVAGGKGELRHVAVPHGEGEKCEVCGRKVAGSYNNRSRFLAKPCPGAPKPAPALTPEEEERRRRIRASKDAYKERRRRADAQVRARPDPGGTGGRNAKSKKTSKEDTVAAKAATNGRTKPGERAEQGENNTRVRNQALGDGARKGGIRRDSPVAPCSRPATALLRAGGPDARAGPGGAAAQSAPPAVAQPAPQATKPLTKRRGRAAPSSPE